MNWIEIKGCPNSIRDSKIKTQKEIRNTIFNFKLRKHSKTFKRVIKTTESQTWVRKNNSSILFSNKKSTILMRMNRALTIQLTKWLKLESKMLFKLPRTRFRTHLSPTWSVYYLVLTPLNCSFYRISNWWMQLIVIRYTFPKSFWKL